MPLASDTRVEYMNDETCEIEADNVGGTFRCNKCFHEVDADATDADVCPKCGREFL